VVDVGRIVTAVCPLERTVEAFAAARSGEHVKVHIQVSTQPGSAGGASERRGSPS